MDPRDKRAQDDGLVMLGPKPRSGAALRWWAFDYLPASLFGSVMGLAGLSVAWNMAHGLYGAPRWPADAIAVVACLDFVFVAVAYLLKAATSARNVLAELAHPVSGSLFGTVFVSMLLMPLILASHSLLLARAVWVLGAIGMLVFAVAVIGRWLGGRQELTHATPAWIVPVVGLLDLPMAMPQLGLAQYREPMIMALAVGLFFTVPIFTMVFARLLFAERLPDPLQPTLLILTAPFSVGYSAYETVAGSNDLFAHCLYLLALFLVAVFAIQIGKSVRRPFRLTWWATSFPLAAISIAALRFSAANPSTPATATAWGLLAFSTFAIAVLVLLTMSALAKGELRLASS
jgi:tellurite resistance protein